MLERDYEAIIGLEIHVQLKTKSKMFCACSNAGEDQPANTTICEVCTAQPGTLPVPNEQAVRWALRAALALNCQIPDNSQFDRKHYFYPDLPKGYQISQYEHPLGLGGYLDIEVDGQARRIQLERLHLEEDTAKLLHEPGQTETRIDFNRAGTPLMEIVTKPDVRSPAEAKAFLKELRLLMLYLGISDADMEKGHLRCDANISLRPSDETNLYSKTEIKNLNSFRSVERALTYEFERQKKLWAVGRPPTQLSTRGWEETKSVTEEQRVKEEASDYRYFPEPDIPPMQFSEAFIAKIQADVPEIPSARRQRFQAEFGFTQEDALRLCDHPILSGYTEAVISELKAWLLAETPKDRGLTWHTHKAEFAKLLANWLINRYLKLCDETHIAPNASRITAENFAELVKIIQQNRVNATGAQTVLQEMFVTGHDPSDIIEKKALGQLQDESSLENTIDQVLAAHPAEVAGYKAGKITLLKFFMGQVMKETGGRADPEVLNRLLVHKLR